MLRYCWFFTILVITITTVETFMRHASLCLEMRLNASSAVWWLSGWWNPLWHLFTCLQRSDVWPVCLNIFCCWRNILAVNLLSRAFIFVATLPFTEWLFVIDEIWNTINVESDVRKLEAFEVWLWTWTRVKKIIWQDGVTNQEVLVSKWRLANTEFCLAKETSRIGRVLRHDSLLRVITDGRMRDKPTRGRSKIQILHDLAKW